MHLRLGKLPARYDRRNLRLATFLKALPPIPPAVDVDQLLSVPVPVPMFANDEWGDCVIAGRAHQTLRFEAFEQDKALAITDQEVLEEYWRQGGGDAVSRPDNGLYLLDSLKAWRKPGWQAAGSHYDIYAFAEISRRDPQEIMAAIYLLRGVYAGFALPLSARAQLDRGQCWYPVTGQGFGPGSWGGHCMYLCGYSHVGVTAVTWGKKQLMSWPFFIRYCDELYGVIDNPNRFTPDSPVDTVKLDQYLRAVT